MSPHENIKQPNKLNLLPLLINIWDPDEILNVQRVKVARMWLIVKSPFTTIYLSVYVSGELIVLELKYIAFPGIVPYWEHNEDCEFIVIDINKQKIRVVKTVSILFSLLIK